MFIVEQHGPEPIVASSPEEAVRKARQYQGRDSRNKTQFSVWDTMSCDFYVIEHDPDWDPTGPKMEFERLIHLDRQARELLVEEMMYRAHCSDIELRKICHMASTMVRSYEACRQWLEEINETKP